MYVFGQFVDHDLDLESTPVNGPAINISVPPNDPVFTSGTSIAMSRDARSPTTNTIVNTVAGYLDLSQLYGSSVGHSQVSDTQDGFDNNGNVVFSESLAQSFFNTPAQDEANGIDALLRGVSTDSSQATDVYTVATLRNLLFAPLVGGAVDEVDLIAIDIQRERDAGLGSLNQTRQAIGLAPYTSFAQLTTDSVLQKSFASVYGTIDSVDLFMGGLAEAHTPGASVGPTFQSIIASQFESLRHGDRFFCMNQEFDQQTRAMIGDTTLANIIRRNTDTTSLQENVFLTHPAPRETRPATSAPINNHGRLGALYLAVAQTIRALRWAGFRPDRRAILRCCRARFRDRMAWAARGCHTC